MTQIAKEKLHECESESAVAKATMEDFEAPPRSGKVVVRMLTMLVELRPLRELLLVSRSLMSSLNAPRD